jgi:hypothetical protein
VKHHVPSSTVGIAAALIGAPDVGIFAPIQVAAIHALNAY